MTLRMTRYIFSFLALVISSSAFSQVHSPKAKEIDISYEATFEMPIGDDTDEAMELHFSHLFGILHSPEFTQSQGVDSSLIEGLGSPQFPIQIDLVSSQENGDLKNIQYKVTARMLIAKTAANKWLKKGSLNLFLPINMSEIYRKKCTDSHYDTEGDYWYFWNPFRSGCEMLQKAPFSNPVKIQIKDVTDKPKEIDTRLDLLRGDNQNGKDFVIYSVIGFAESGSDPKDDGKANFKTLIDYLKANEFKRIPSLFNNSARQLSFEKTVTDSRGKEIRIVMHTLLANTDIDSRSKAFAKFFKQAFEEGDVVFYGGHSGLGGNLDLDSLQEKAGGKFQLNEKKRQLYFIDSCSSYSYYLDSFRQLKSLSKLDIITNALSSYFETGPLVLQQFLDTLTDPDKNPSWEKFLEDLEEPLEGASYLLNVGAV